MTRHFPLVHGGPRVDDRCVVSVIVCVIKHGLRWKAAPKGYGPHKTLCNRFIRWSRVTYADGGAINGPTLQRTDKGIGVAPLPKPQPPPWPK
ncbi:MAG: transposase [Alsobacter sp.]